MAGLRKTGQSLGARDLPRDVLGRLRSDRRIRLGFLLVGIPLASVYLLASFLSPIPWLRILLRTLPFLPVVTWTLWMDAARPFQRTREPVRTAGRIALLLGVMAAVVLLLGLALNWLFNPQRLL